MAAAGASPELIPLAHEDADQPRTSSGNVSLRRFALAAGLALTALLVIGMAGFLLPGKDAMSETGKVALRKPALKLEMNLIDCKNGCFEEAGKKSSKCKSAWTHPGEAAQCKATVTQEAAQCVADCGFQVISNVSDGIMDIFDCVADGVKDYGRRVNDCNEIAYNATVICMGHGEHFVWPEDDDLLGECSTLCSENGAKCNEECRTKVGDSVSCTNLCTGATIDCTKTCRDVLAEHIGKNIDDCTTTGSFGVGADKKCTFPFKYEGVSHDTCTKEDNTKRWCYTEVHEGRDGVLGQWGHCGTACHNEADGLSQECFTKAGECSKACKSAWTNPGAASDCKADCTAKFVACQANIAKTFPNHVFDKGKCVGEGQRNLQACLTGNQLPECGF